MRGALGLLFLAGLVLVPVWLLVVGHRLRDRGRRARGAFWGVALGYAVGAATLLWRLLAPPRVWPPEGSGLVLVAGALLAASLAGGAVGALVGRRRH